MKYICENDLCEFKTNNGVFITNPLPLGNYELTEISNYVEGYQINSTPLRFTIEKASNFIKEDNEYQCGYNGYQERGQPLQGLEFCGDNLCHR